MAAARSLWAGAGRATITPPVGIAHGGWGAQVHERAEGVDQDLLATALVVGDDDGLQVAIVELDLCVLQPEQCDAIRAAVTALTGIPRERVRASTSHTHAAPVTDVVTGGWIRAGRELVGPYLAALPGLAAGAVFEAQGRLRRCTVGGGLGRCYIGVNRRVSTGSGLIGAGHNWDGPMDPTVAVVRIDAEDGETIATLVNYGCHPTTAGPDNRLLSPDYPGVVRQVVEQALGGTCLFLQGAAGDVGTIGGFSGDLRIHKRLGAILGHEAAAVALQVNTRPLGERVVGVQESGASLVQYAVEPVGEPDASLGAETRYVEMPLKDAPPPGPLEDEAARAEEALYTARARRAPDEEIVTATMLAKRAAMQAERARWIHGRATYAMEIHGLRIGPIGIVGAPLEPFSEIGMRVRARSPFPVTLFCGYTNGYRSYLPTASEIPRGGYEVEFSLFGPGGAERLEEGALAVLEALSRGRRPERPQGPPWSVGTARRDPAAAGEHGQSRDATY